MIRIRDIFAGRLEQPQGIRPTRQAPLAAPLEKKRRFTRRLTQAPRPTGQLGGMLN